MLARSRSLVLLALAAMALSPAAADAAKRKPKPTCYPKKAKTVKVNEVARVYRRRETISGTGGLTGSVLYGCDLKTKRKIRLATSDYYAPDAVSVVLLGRYVAANYTSSDPAGVSSGYLRVWDLRSRKRLHSVADVGADEMAIGSKGTLAWIGGKLVDSGDPEPAPSVHLLDAKGDRAVATGGVVRGSLAVAGTTVYWTQNRAPFSATLSP
jgi:hypothetical protein